MTITWRLRIETGRAHRMRTFFGKRTVLVVDDEEQARENLRRFLNLLGRATTVASDGQEALNLAERKEFDVVLMDVKMPGMGGLEALAKFQANYPDTVVVMATAVGEIDTAMEAMQLGAYDYIVKPFDLDNLGTRVAKAIEKRDAALREQEFRGNLEQRVAKLVDREEANFAELVRSLWREHAMLFASDQAKKSKEGMSIPGLPSELRWPLSSVEEFHDALIRILRRAQL